MDSNSKRYLCTYSSYVFSWELYFNLGRHELNGGHKKEQYTDRTDEHDKNIKSYYGSHLLGVEVDPIVVVCYEEGS